MVALLLAAWLVVMGRVHFARLTARIQTIPGDARRWSLPASGYELILGVLDSRPPACRAVRVDAPVRGPPTFGPPSDPAAAFRR
jgi:hypothetical protein